MTEKELLLERLRREGAEFSGVRRSCPRCGRLLFEKITVTEGVIGIKCPRCAKMIYCDLRLRRAAPRRYRNENGGPQARP